MMQEMDEHPPAQLADAPTLPIESPADVTTAFPDQLETKSSEPESTPKPAPVPERKLTLAMWSEIEAACTDPDNPLTFTQAEAKFGVSRKTISQRANRKHWAIPRIIAKAIEQKLEGMAEKVAINWKDKWKDKGEKHREVAFYLAHESLKKMKPKAPKNFREAEAADKIARRAAGLEVSEISQQTLIQINDAIDAHVLPCDASGKPTPIEAEIIEADQPPETSEQSADNAAPTPDATPVP